MRDGRLKEIFREKFPDWQWSSLETGAICPGIPDALFCAPGGTMGLIEYKNTEGWKVVFQPLQPAYIYKCARLGGRVFIAVRRKGTELYLIPGTEVLDVAENGVKGREPISRLGRSWDFAVVKNILLGPLAF